MYGVGEVAYTSSMLARRSSKNHLRQTIRFVVIDVTCTAFVRLQASQRRKKYRHSKRENLNYTEIAQSLCAWKRPLSHVVITAKKTTHPTALCAVRSATRPYWGNCKRSDHGKAISSLDGRLLICHSSGNPPQVRTAIS